MNAPEDLVMPSSFRFTLDRVLVAILVFGWLLLASPWPDSLYGMGIVIVLALVALGGVLSIRTSWLAFTPAANLDERERALRDRAYRIAFRLVAVAVLLMFVLTIARSYTAMARTDLIAAQLPDGFSGRTIAALLVLLLILPTAVIAWLQPADADLGSARPSAWLPLIVVPFIGAAWLLASGLGPAQTLKMVGSNGGFSEEGATCQHYAAQKRVGLGFGGAVRMGAEVCWNGQKAFVVGDPALKPAGADLPLQASFIPKLADLVSCAPYPTDTDFARVKQGCSEQIDEAGNMRLLVTGVVSPIGASLGERNLEIELVVDRNGKLLRFG